MKRSLLELWGLFWDFRILFGPRNFRIIIAGLALALSLFFFSNSIAEKFEYHLSDSLITLDAERSSPNKDLIMLNIDSESLAAIPERWPWSLSLYCKILDRIASGKPSEIYWNLPLPDKEAMISAQEMPDAGKIGHFQSLRFYSLNVSRREIVAEKPATNPDSPFSPVPARFLNLAFDSDLRIRAFKRNTSKELFDRLLTWPEKDGGIPGISLKDIFSPNFRPERLQDKVVIVGQSAPILHDSWHTSAGHKNGGEILGAFLDAEKKTTIFRSYGIGFRLTGIFLGLLVGAILATMFSSMALVFSLILIPPICFLLAIIMFKLGFVLPIGHVIISLVFGSVLISLVNLIRDRVYRRTMMEEGHEVAKIQQTISPQEALLTPTGARIQGFSSPCELAGGDFFDFFLQKDGSVFFFIGDVSGHGFSAGFLTTMAKALITHFRQKVITNPASILLAINNVLLSILKREMSMTAVAGIFYPEQERILLSFGAHPPALLFRENGELEQILRGTFPLGINPKATLEKIPVHNVPFHPGERLLLYTDGLYEANNAQGTMLSFQGWKILLKSVFPGTLFENVFQRIMERVNKFTGGAPFSDDVTMVLLGFDKPKIVEKTAT